MVLRAGDPESIGGYALERRLGSGGMGTVYLARSDSGRRLAVKVVHQQFAEDEEFRTRFRQEIAAARRVSGAFTAPVVDADADAARPWMATSYVPGPTLAERISHQGPLRGAELRRLAIGLAEALRDIHRAGVVHRDLKPGNVLLAADGPKVIDFGISRATDHQTLTMTGRVMGTPPFMSPEQLRTPREVGPESDVFALAAVLVYAATGHSPFTADTPYLSAYHVMCDPPELSGLAGPLRRITADCLAKRPASRPALPELLARLRALPDEEEAGSPWAAVPRPAGRVARATPRPPGPPRTRRHRPCRARLTTVAALFLVAVAQPTPTPPPRPDAPAATTPTEGVRKLPPRPGPATPLSRPSP
ncbi:serine/threonine-protein kinase [Streptomyces sp. SAJ15]|uniref:serine/threonine-protein kinase n=1 Tax=Streptomyces sp. SAJ15 TaxID=2011095 RepID=UPI0011861C1B|nr:hypothetical protein CD790_10135 [Streptomyces sp. SAJ15]